jgi:L-ascorbate metabolism protein UlaG (beta-lactamase superfamily)
MHLMDRVLAARMPADEVRIWSLGGAGVVLKSENLLVMVDPFLGDLPEGSEFARLNPAPFSPRDVSSLDCLLSTHEHVDHCDPSTVMAAAEKTAAVFVGPPTSVSLAAEWGYPRHRLRTLRCGDTLSLRGMEVVALPYTDPGCPVGNAYSIRLGGLDLVHCGDSFGNEGLVEYGQTREVDAAFVSVANNPPGRLWYMGPNEAFKVASRLNPKVFVPVHWNALVQTWLDPRRIRAAAREVGLSDRTTILNVGESVTVTRSGRSYDQH